MSALVIRPGERIRVLRIIARLNVGGPALHVSLLTSMLDPTRFESRLVTGSENPGDAEREVGLFFQASDLVDYRRSTEPWIVEKA